MDGSALENQFIEITGGDRNQAKYYLTKHKYKLQEAIESYMENPNEYKNSEDKEPKEHHTDRKVIGLPNPFANQDRGQTYYTGGKESGLAVYDPQDYMDDGNKSIPDSLIKHAQDIHKDPMYNSGMDDGKEIVTKTLTMWKNGFQIEDGDLRDYNTPENKKLFELLHKGQVPHQFFPDGNMKANVDVQLVDKKSEDYKQPPPQLKPFTGVGARLGFESTTKQYQPEKKPSYQPSNPQVQSKPLDLTQSDNQTNLQIRLHDGTRLVSKFDPNSSILEVINFIKMSRLDLKNSNITLMTNFPKKILTNENATLKEEGLLNSVVIVKI
ncbi:hypothetical protein M0811_03551 [Anaeramoeba ignava]|uniref:Uncharacterized protein n=1 Tax=Anaeramoeba ignava TaxID=1746090 RepID=A0A9Q0L6Y3_ANAIG|nr:hypothetical protein M0811_03551 [Anaeramoeba ignava]|eukprot:Anaeramoba_ignava/a218179_108.p1 GENE.a218179_108~~a218179_108.p1  ORF type:complete len:342 (+),score=86.42 a218179_108:52-1026(+)